MKKLYVGGLALRPKEEDAGTEPENFGTVAASRQGPSPAAERNDQLAADELKGRGRLIPAQATGIEYPVEFGIQSPPAGPQHGRVLKPTRWVKCFIRSAQRRVFPDGSYFLRTDEGRVHQLKMIDGVWHCLALAL
jgi:hypothetical protein